MAVPAGATLRDEVTELIRTEQFSNRKLIENAGLPVHMALGPLEYAGAGNSATYRWTREKELDETDGSFFTYASPKTEGDDGGYGDPYAFETDKAEATAKVLGVKRQVGYEALQDATGMSLLRVIMNSFRGCMRRTSRDVLLRIKDVSSNTSSFSNLPFNRDRAGVVKSALEGQNADGPFAWFLGLGHVRTYEADVRSSGAMVVTPGDQFSNVRGYKGQVEGMPAFSSSLGPTEDADNDNGCLYVLGDRSPFGLASWWDLGATPGETFNDAGGVISFNIGPYLVEIVKDPNQDSYFCYVKNRMATALVYEGNIREFIAID